MESKKDPKDNNINTKLKGKDILVNLKLDYKDTLILIKSGNFYRLFNEDAVIFNYLKKYKYI